MRYFHSQKSFNQYKPHQSFWQRLKTRYQKKSDNVVVQPSLKNPFKKEVAAPKNRNRLVWSFLILIILIWIVLIFTIPYFKINKVTIEGNKINKTIELESFVYQSAVFKNSLLPNTNYFLFRQEALAQEIQKQFLYENVKVNKIFPDAISIVVTEKPASVIFDDNRHYYLLDADGKIIKKITDISRAEFETINTATTTAINTSTTASSSLQNTNTDIANYNVIQKNYGQLPIIKKDKENKENNGILINKKIIELVNIWDKNLQQQGIAEVRYFYIGDTDFNLKAIFANKPWYILINTDLDWQIQLSNLKIILSGNSPTEYVDLRFGERVYWK